MEVIIEKLLQLIRTWEFVALIRRLANGENIKGDKQ
jgi:hypothetical protein